MRALITGAAKGLGRALTDQLLDEGHEVVAVDIDTDDLDELAVLSRGACRVHGADMASAESVARLLHALAGVKFDLVVLNAGISATGKFEELPREAYERLIRVNLQGPLIMASGLLAGENMVAKSKMVFISSLSNATGYPGAAVYSATKQAIAIYAKSLRKPFKKRGVKILTVYPGPIKTDHAAKHAPAGAKADKRMAPEKLAKMILKAAKGRAKELYPGFGAEAARMMGGLFPTAMTKLMRRIIYDKLDRNEF